MSGDRIVLKYITVKNTAGSGDTAGQAIAVYAETKTARFENVRLISRQDMLFLAPLPDAPRAFGSFIVPCENKPINGYITATSTTKNQKYGFIFYHCKLSSNCSPGTVFLGRPWRKYASTAFIECTIVEHISTHGWALWSPNSNEQEPVRFAEYQNLGIGADKGQRVPWASSLTHSQMQKYIAQIKEISKI